MPVLRIPTPLRAYTNGQSNINVAGANISEALTDLTAQYPTIKPHLFKGSVLVFDELADDIFPGETIALREVFDVTNLRVERMPMTARVSYVVL